MRSSLLSCMTVGEGSAQAAVLDMQLLAAGLVLAYELSVQLVSGL